MALHVNRFIALKAILLKPPHPHPPTRGCDFSAQRKLTRLWSLVSAHFAWDARPDLSAHQMKAALDPLMIQLECRDCQITLRDRIKDLIVQWTAVRLLWQVYCLMRPKTDTRKYILLQFASPFFFFFGEQLLSSPSLTKKIFCVISARFDDAGHRTKRDNRSRHTHPPKYVFAKC
jgi:hypothetical protein